jgi:hypothetical protein
MVMSENRELSEAVRRMLADLRQKQVGQTLEDMRKDLVRADERVVAFSCARSGEPFHVRFARPGPGKKFCISAVVKGAQPQHQPAGLFKLWAKTEEAPAVTGFDIAEFDFTGWVCPWCQASGATGRIAFVKCTTCNGLVCGGRIRQLRDGRDWFVCHDGCGNESGLTNGLTQVDGEGRSRVTGIAAPKSGPKISGNNAGRLPGPRK